MDDARPIALPRGLRTDWPVPWQPVWGTRDGPSAHLEHWLLTGVVGAASRMPAPLLGALVSGLARLAARLDHSHAGSARGFLRQALGDLPEVELRRRVIQAYRHLVTVVVEGQRFAREVPPEEVLGRYELDLCDDVQRAREAGRGAVIVSAHVGDWEAASALLPWLGFDPLYAFAKPPKNRPMSKALQRSRERRGIRVLPRRGGMRDARAIIRAGGSLGMLLDQRGSKKPIVAPFFGRPALCDRSAGVLLRRLSAPVLICACYRTSAPLRYRFVCRTVLWPEEVAGLSPEELATQVNGALEKLILAAPDQYLWLHDRYRGAPPQDGEGAGR